MGEGRVRHRAAFRGRGRACQENDLCFRYPGLDIVVYQETRPLLPLEDMYRWERRFLD